MAAALTWIEANPSAWHRIVGGAQRDALDNVPVRLKYYVEAMRADRSLQWATEDFKLPNAVTAALARVLVAWHPEVAPWVRLSSSKLDGCVVPPRPY